MHFKNILLFFFLLSFSYLNAQKQKDILFTVADEPVYTGEFLKVFNKNRDIVSEENKKSVEEYLELFINYKLKLKQAYELKYDTVSAYKKELAQYREQLITPYLTDSKITSALVEEAYERTKTEVNASHILIRLQPKATTGDTLAAYQKIIEARNKIVEGASFEKIAKQYSEDPSAQNNGGNLGYFSAFAMVYPFENAAFNTKINKVSMPFKTQFGYHIVKVNDIRKSKGEVEVAHIMIKENEKDSLYANTKINELYAKLNQGERFEILAQSQSEDRNSAINGGKLAKFNATRMIKEFADVAFAMENSNDISTPFKTPYGWHIIKLIKKYPVKSFDDLKSELTNKIEKSKRYKIAGTSIVKRLINEYKITKNEAILNLYFTNDTIGIAENLKTSVLSINGEVSQLDELIEYSATNNKSAKDSFVDFFENKVLTYYRENLERTDADFAFTLKEYKDGLLLFDLLQDKVWKRAEKDTIGLKDFFAKNQQNYFWKRRGDVTIASCTKENKAVLVKKYLEEKKTLDEIKELVNEGATIHVLFSKGILEEDHSKFPKDFVLEKEGVSDIINDNKLGFVVVKVHKILQPQPMLLKEAKGSVINDFQDFLDKQWTEDLKRQYPVRVKKKVLKKLIKQNQS